jgi:hypothetical protein
LYLEYNTMIKNNTVHTPELNSHIQQPNLPHCFCYDFWKKQQNCAASITSVYYLSFPRKQFCLSVSVVVVYSWIARVWFSEKGLLSHRQRTHATYTAIPFPGCQAARRRANHSHSSTWSRGLGCDNWRKKNHLSCLRCKSIRQCLYVTINKRIDLLYFAHIPQLN